MAFHPWSQVGVSLGRATDNILSSRSFYTRFKESSDGTLIYQSKRAYDSVLVHTAKQLGFQLAEHYANMATEFLSTQARYGLQWLFGHKRVRQAVEKAKTESAARQVEIKEAREKADKIRKKQAENVKSIIEAGAKVDDGLGKVQVEGGDYIFAEDAYGTWVKEALMLYYDTEDNIEYVEMQNGTEASIIDTKTLVFYDVNAQVSQSTSKNIVLTKVQGRDYTRKELVSGGDIVFSVNGMANSNQPGVYPEGAVKKLIQLCQYNGVVKINHILAKQFGVTQVIIQDFKLGTQECKNEQPYSMTLVAVEPDEDVTVTKDTIMLINDVLADTDMAGWYQALLTEKAAQAQSGTSDSARSKKLLWFANNI